MIRSGAMKLHLKVAWVLIDSRFLVYIMRVLNTAKNNKKNIYEHTFCRRALSRK